MFSLHRVRGTRVNLYACAHVCPRSTYRGDKARVPASTPGGIIDSQQFVSRSWQMWPGN